MQKNQLKIYISIFVIFLVACLGFFFFKSFFPKEVVVEDAAANRALDEVEKIKNANSEILSNVNSASLSNFREVDESDHVLGDINTAKVKLVVYCNFENELCLNYSKTLEKAQKEFGSDVAVAFRHFYNVYEKNAEAAAIASECADEQGRFWEMKDALYNKGPKFLGRDLYIEIADTISLDLDKFNECIDSEKYKDKVRKQIKEADSFYVLGTPETFVNKEKVTGDSPYEDFTDSAGINRVGLRNIIESYIN